VKITIQYFDKKASGIVRIIRLLRFSPFLGGLILGFAANCSPAAPAGDQTNRFGFALLSQLMATHNDENVVVSPFSLELALGMVYAGCSGISAHELSRVIGFIPQDDSQQILFPGMTLSSHLPPTITLNIANALWCDSSTRLRPTFVAKIKDLFHPEIQSGDLATPETMKAINEWVAKATDGRITGLLQQPPKPPLVLIDAVYFKGAWGKPFSAAQNFSGQFHRRKTGPCEVTMMKRNLAAPYLATDDFQAIKLPYDGGTLEMVLILPDKETDLATLAQKLRTGSWKDTIAEFSEASGSITLPKFKVSYRDSLIAPLTELGIKAIFQPSQDFAPMFDDARKFFVSGLIQQTYLRVDENGSEAAAATEVQMEATAMRRQRLKPFDLVLDRPFLFAIVDDESGQLLFAGVLREPEKAKL
jgi:serine protease inhibitor